MKVKKIFLLLGIFGAIQFLVFTTYAMTIYPGGTIHNHSLDVYSFFTNYFSDLGRTRTFNGASNWACHTLFKTALTILGICIILFFITLQSFFENGFTKVMAILATFFGIIAGACYIGLSWLPYDIAFWEHRYFVQAGFISFLLMSLFYSIAIFYDEIYPNKYGWAFLMFMMILVPQIIVMIYGPRSWTSPNALLLQATSQKVVVYSQILCLLYQAVGLWKLESRLRTNL